MIGAVRRQAVIYGAVAGMVPKERMAYTTWVWTSLFVHAVMMTIYVFFWRAVYEGTDQVAGLSQTQTLNYILLVQLFLPLAYSTSTIQLFGRLLREGEFAQVLLRPLDFQLSTYLSDVAGLGVALLFNLPLALLALLWFDLQLPSSPLVWGAALVAMLLGHAALFCLDWIFACLAFSITEIWGLGVARYGIATFLSGSLVPLAMMPGWLRGVAEVLPFAQALYLPISLLSGITPLGEALLVWRTQVVTLVVLGVASRLIFNVAVRKVTVQGG